MYCISIVGQFISIVMVIASFIFIAAIIYEELKRTNSKSKKDDQKPTRGW